MLSVKAVFHIDEIGKWPLLLANVRNLIRAVDVKTSHVVVLAYSKAVSVFDGITLQNHSDALTEISTSEVEILVCQNSLNGLHIPQKQLPAVVTVVPVGRRFSSN